MLMQANKQFNISLQGAFKWVGLTAGTLGILTVLTATVAYIPGNPDFSIFTTYLSDIGDTPGWPQILFNSGTLLAAPLRYLVIVLLALLLHRMGAGRGFLASVLVVGFFSTLGTVLMTAVPFSVALAVHKSGIGLYFFGVVILQTMVFFKEKKMENVPNVLAWLSLLIVAVYLVFFVLIIMYEMGGLVSRSTPVIWEWGCFAVSIAWVYAHSLLLGKPSGG